MEKQFEILRKTRRMLLRIVDGLSIEQMNKVPPGFNNNIVWNLGHVIAAQQGICYKSSGLPFIIDEALFQKYRPDTKPQEVTDETEVSQLKGLLLTTIDDLQRDYESNKFAVYPPWTTRYGVEIKSIEDAIRFLSFHDGLHIGYAMALKRCVNAVQTAVQPAL